MDDLISRQAVLEATSAKLKITGKENAETVYEYIKKLCDDIKALPSAQPEIIRCKDCKWWTKQKDSLQGRCALFGMYPTGEWYCANAKMEVEHE